MKKFMEWFGRFVLFWVMMSAGIYGTVVGANALRLRLEERWETTAYDLEPPFSWADRLLLMLHVEPDFEAGLTFAVIAILGFLNALFAVLVRLPFLLRLLAGIAFNALLLGLAYGLLQKGQLPPVGILIRGGLTSDPYGWWTVGLLVIILGILHGILGVLLIPGKYKRRRSHTSAAEA